MSYGRRDTPLSSRQIALLHVAKAKLGLDEGSYRSVLSLYGGAESAKEMTLGGFQRVMKYFQNLGFDAPQFFPEHRHRRPNAGAVIERRQQMLIQGLYSDIGMDTAERQQGFCRRIIKKPWPQTRGEANKIIEGLKAMLRRRSVG